MAKNDIVYQFKIELAEIEPTIWRVIQVPSKYTFWDLHVAIQDSMGWLDYHLHVFRVRMSHQRKDSEIGIPDDDFDNHKVLPCWEVPIADFFISPGKSAIYKYDFGDNWSHYILLEGILLKKKDVKYPICIQGERACPPEDCGGVSGYYQLIEILGNSNHPEYAEYVEWLKAHAKNYHPYEPDTFEPEKIKFWNPKKRWEKAFS